MMMMIIMRIIIRLLLFQMKSGTNMNDSFEYDANTDDNVEDEEDDSLLENDEDDNQMYYDNCRKL
jgi:hypothetical protein